MTKVRIGTRGSALALVQANWVKTRLLEREPTLSVEIRKIKTSGDRLPDLPLANLGGKGVFTKEIEEALLREEIDLAVHSMKDLPPHLPSGLVIAATPPREDPRDALVTRTSGSFKTLKPGTRIGTGSLRRQAQLLHARPDLMVVPIRGNVDTRLRKLDQGEVDALVLAAAGLKRLGREQRIGEHLTDDICVSAAAQGCLGIETREQSATHAHLAFLHDPDAFVEVAAERAMLDRLGGSCRVPIGARARLDSDKLHLVGVVASPDGKRLCRSNLTGDKNEAVDLGNRVAEELLRQGARELLGWNQSA